MKKTKWTLNEDGVIVIDKLATKAKGKATKTKATKAKGKVVRPKKKALVKADGSITTIELRHNGNLPTVRYTLNGKAKTGELESKLELSSLAELTMLPLEAYPLFAKGIIAMFAKRNSALCLSDSNGGTLAYVPPACKTSFGQVIGFTGCNKMVVVNKNAMFDHAALLEAFIGYGGLCKKIRNYANIRPTAKNTAALIKAIKETFKG